MNKQNTQIKLKKRIQNSINAIIGGFEVFYIKTYDGPMLKQVQQFLTPLLKEY